MIGRPVHSPWALVLRYPHANAEPVIEGLHGASSPAFGAAYKVKGAYPAHKVTVLHQGQEWEVGKS